MTNIKGTGPVKLKTIGWGIPGYDDYMTYKSYIKTISRNQIVQERLEIMNFFDKYGARATKEAYLVSRATIYAWKKVYKDSGYNPSSLIPKATKPKNTRRMIVDPLILHLITDLRRKYHLFGKSKIKPLLDEFCIQKNIPTISESTIGKIIKNNNLTFPPPNTHKRKSFSKGKVKSRHSIRIKTTSPGEVVQVDTIVRYEAGVKRYIITALDTYSRYAFAFTYKSLSSRMALDFMQKLEYASPFPIKAIKTDNGFEFMGEFDKYLNQKEITHFFTYPNTPKSNGYVERFNRTVQDEFVEYNLHFIDNTDEFNARLCEYLIFYNSIRPHHGINKCTPLSYLVFKGILSRMCATYTTT